MNLKTPSGTIFNLYANMLDQSHVLIVGCSGAGKSTVIHGMINTLLYHFPTEKNMVLIDPLGIELKIYSKLPHTIGYAEKIDDIALLINQINQVMDRRYEELLLNNTNIWAKEHIYIFIDDFISIAEASKGIVEIITRIGSRGRKVGIHLVCASQSCSRKYIPSNLISNMTSTMALRTKSYVESNQAIGISGAEKLPQNGYGLYMCSDSEGVRRVKVPQVEQNEIMRIVNWWEMQV